MAQVALKWLITALMSKLAQEMATEVVLITLRRWAASTETTWDDEIVDALESKLK